MGSTAFVGMDVHKATIAVAIAKDGRAGVGPGCGARGDA